jgi:hypothetical protein
LGDALARAVAEAFAAFKAPSFDAMSPFETFSTFSAFAVFSALAEFDFSLFELELLFPPAFALPPELPLLLPPELPLPPFAAWALGIARIPAE